MTRVRASRACAYTADGHVQCGTCNNEEFSVGSDVGNATTETIASTSGSAVRPVISIRPNIICSDKEYKSTTAKSMLDCANKCLSDNRCGFATFAKTGNACRLYPKPCTNPRADIKSTALYKYIQPTNQWIPDFRCGGGDYEELNSSQNNCMQSCVSDPACVSATYTPKDSMCAKTTDCATPIVNKGTILFHKR